MRGAPYVLVAERATKVPGMHAPLYVVRGGGSTQQLPVGVVGGKPAVVVAYDGSPAKYFTGAFVDRTVVPMASRSNRSTKWVVAVEHGDRRLAESLLKLQSPSFAYFIGKTIQTKLNVARNAMGGFGDNGPRAVALRAALRLGNAKMSLADLDETIRAIDRAPVGRRQNANKYVTLLREVAKQHRRQTSVRKRHLRQNVSRDWPDDTACLGIQQYKRGTPRPGNTYFSNMAGRLDRYMKSFALRAPAMPPKVRNTKSGSEFPVLYRGVPATANATAELNRRGEWRDKGYMAFSRDMHTALQFGRTLFKLDVRDVQRGTPWIWFAGPNEVCVSEDWDNELQNLKWVHAGFVAKDFDPGAPGVTYEREVLLPPGTIRVKAVSRLASGVTVYEGEYRPDPAYLLR